MTSSVTLKSAVFHILLSLSGRTLHGLGIAETVEQATDGAVTLGPGTLYRSLKEMMRDGLIEEAAAPEGEADPRRRFYRITEGGRAAARAEALRLERLVDVARANQVLPERP